jgi:hypothetical protein
MLSKEPHKHSKKRKKKKEELKLMTYRKRKRTSEKKVKTFRPAGLNKRGSPNHTIIMATSRFLLSCCIFHVANAYLVMNSLSWFAPLITFLSLIWGHVIFLDEVIDNPNPRSSFLLLKEKVKKKKIKMVP